MSRGSPTHLRWRHCLVVRIPWGKQGLNPAMKQHHWIQEFCFLGMGLITRLCHKHTCTFPICLKGKGGRVSFSSFLSIPLLQKSSTEWPLTDYQQGSLSAKHSKKIGHSMPYTHQLVGFQRSLLLHSARGHTSLELSATCNAPCTPLKPQDIHSQSKSTTNLWAKGWNPVHHLKCLKIQPRDFCQ